MAPWNREPRQSADTYTTRVAPGGTSPTRDGHHHEKAAAGPRRFSFGSWLRLHGVDLITMALMGAIGLGVYFAPPASNRSFPLLFRDGEIVYPEFAYPLRKEIVPIWLAALIAFLAPFLTFVLFQIRHRSLDYLLTTTMGLLKSLITAAVFQVWIKWLIGGLRPHFYAVCQPRITQDMMATGTGYQGVMFDRSVCTGDKDQIDDSLESMPSGHSTAGFAGLIFLALYINAQLKVMSAHNPAYWKMVFFFMPILGACLIAGAITLDEFHNWYDVLAGAFIGTACAFVAFRQTFASIWDFRFNHVLLPRTTSLFHRQPYTAGFTSHAANPSATYPFFTYAPQAATSGNLPFTREGGWGWAEEAAVGAPGDATVLMNGAGTGLGSAGGMGGGNYGRAEAGMAHPTAAGRR